MLGAIGSASGGVSAATASIIGGGERLLAGTVTGVGTGGLIATLLFLTTRDLPAPSDQDRDRTLAVRRGADGSATPLPRGPTGRFAHHVVHHAETGPATVPTSAVRDEPIGPDGGDETVGVGLTSRGKETEAGELFDLLGALITEDDRPWADQGQQGDADQRREPTPEGTRDLERRDGSNPPPEQVSTSTERPPAADCLCPPPERRSESGCSARDRSTTFEHGSRDGYGRNRRRHRPR